MREEKDGKAALRRQKMRQKKESLNSQKKQILIKKPSQFFDMIGLVKKRKAVTKSKEGNRRLILCIMRMNL